MTENKNSYNIAKEKMIDQAFADAEKMTDEQFDNIEIINHEFSKRHNDKMDKLFEELKAAQKKESKKSMTKLMKIAACIVVIITIASAATIIGVEAWKRSKLDFVLESGQPNSDFNLGENSVDEYSDEKVELSYMPVGFELNNITYDVNRYFLNFKSNSQYFQITISNSLMNTSLDTEDAEYENITIKGEPGKYIHNDNINSVVFKKDDYSIVILGNINKNELIKIASNLTVLS